MKPGRACRLAIDTALPPSTAARRLPLVAEAGDGNSWIVRVASCLAARADLHPATEIGHLPRANLGSAPAENVRARFLPAFTKARSLEDEAA